MYYTEEEQKRIRQAQDDTVMRIGREKGFAEGLEKGRAEGLEKGMLEANIATARRMLAKGMAISDISSFTGLPEVQINSLVN